MLTGLLPSTAALAQPGEVNPALPSSDPAARIVESRVWTDPSGRVPAEAVPLDAFEPYRHTLARGYTSDVVWVLLRVRHAEGGGPQVLQIRPAMLDRIDLHDLSRPGEGPWRTGRIQPWQPGERLSLTLNFELPAPAPGAPMERLLLLRLQSSTALVFSAQVLDAREASRSDLQGSLLVLAFLGLLSVLGLWALRRWWRERETVYAWFGLRQLVSVLHASVLMGLPRPLLAGVLDLSVIDRLSLGLVLGLGAALAAFEWRFRRSFGLRSRGIETAFGAYLVGSVGLFLVWAWSGPSLALQLNAWMLLGGNLIMVCAAFTLPRQARAARLEPEVRRGLSFYYPILVLTSVPALLHSLGIVAPRIELYYFHTAYAAAAGLLAAALLATAARRRFDRLQQAMLEQEAARTQLQQERLRREETDRFLAMLTHELRNPLAAVNLLADPSTDEGQRIRVAVQDMSQVLDRSLQAARLGDEQVQAQPVPVPLAALVARCVERTGRAERIDLDLGPLSGRTLHTDPLILGLILDNLLDNALKYGPGPAGRVALSARAMPAAGVCLRIANTVGPAGWPDPARLFEKHYRSPGAQRQIGAGLGLYIVQGMAALIEARLEYRPQAEGSPQRIVFELTVPQVQMPGGPARG